MAWPTQEPPACVSVMALCQGAGLAEGALHRREKLVVKGVRRASIRHVLQASPLLWQREDILRMLQGLPFPRCQDLHYQRVVYLPLPCWCQIRNGHFAAHACPLLWHSEPVPRVGPQERYPFWRQYGFICKHFT